jgi:hypothetical protein
MVISSCVALAAASQIDNDLLKDGFRGPVKKVEVFETELSEDGETCQRVTWVETYNEDGNTIESISFTYDGNGSYFERIVYFRDADGRKALATKHISEKGQRNERFCGDEMLRRLKPSLATHTTYIYDRSGLEIERSVTDKNGIRQGRWLFEYDKAGRETKFQALDQKDEELWAVTSTYSAGDSIKEDIRTEKGKLSQKVVSKFDAKGRLLDVEQYSLAESDNGNQNPKSTIQSKSRRLYEGNRTEMEWMIYDPSGLPATKLLITDEDDEEISRTEFDLGKSSSNVGVTEQGLVPPTRERNEYERDKHGNWIKHVYLSQQNVGEEPKPYRIYERVITYF